MAVDASMRKLKIPQRFMPYMEKHRIYELFHDLANELAIARPLDPLTFLKSCLEQIEKHRDKRIVIILAPPCIDRIKLAHLISVKTGCSMLSRYLCIKNPIDYYSPSILSKGVLEQFQITKQMNWIFADFPNTFEEADELIRSGVLPTHTFLLMEENIFEFEDDSILKGNFSEFGEEANIKKINTTPSMLMDYVNDLYRLKELYKSSLKIVKIKSRSLEDLAEACARVARKLPSKHAPRLFRVVLLGPRGSRRRTIAKLISKQLNLVHVDMEQLINATRVSETEEGDELRYLDKNGYSYSLKTVFDLLRVRLAEEDCLSRGYVLTNFPTSVEDFLLLDSLETPPNKVIFLDISDTDCLNRLEDRVVNMHTGTLHSRKIDPKNPELLTHPDDESCKVRNEIDFYNEKLAALKEYCGETAFVVDGTGSTNSMLERVECVLMSPSPAAKPRSGVLPELRFRSKTVVMSTEQFPPPPTRTEVVPMIESAELLRRFSDLKKTVVKGRRGDGSSDDNDLVMRELDREFELALEGGISRD